MFVIDVTGSMGDELEYLKTELVDVIGQAKKKYPEYELRLDVFVTGTMEMNL